MKSQSEALELLRFAEQLARGAGALTHRYFKEGFTAERKADRSYVTIADREAERLLRVRIEEAFPDDGILGEEDVEKPGQSGRRWILDPIDGTYSFVHRVPLYGVLIGLEVDEEPTLGVVNLPGLGDLVSAIKGHGCFWNGQRVRTSAIRMLDEALLLTTSFEACEEHKGAAGVDKLRRKVNASRTWGDCYGHILVATGRAEVMLDPVMNIWDCAALLPIVEEAGGTFTDWNGESTIRGGEAISTNGKVFREVMETISKVMSDE